MNKLLEEYLHKKYPTILQEYGKNPSESAMGWGMTCDDGWFFLIETLCSSIEHYVQCHNDWVKRYGLSTWQAIKEGKNKEASLWMAEEPKLIPEVVATTIKEKFGTLRFYYRGGDEMVKGMVHIAEELSGRICEKCGRTDELVGQNLTHIIKTTCPCCCETPKAKEEQKENLNEELVVLLDKVRNEKLVALVDNVR